MPANTASGLTSAGRAAIVSAAPRPASVVSSRSAIVDSDTGDPCERAASTAAWAPLRRSCTCVSEAGPPANTSRLRPNDIRWSAAIRPPATSSTLTEQKVGSAGDRSRNTTGIPSLAKPSNTGGGSPDGAMRTPRTRCSSKSSRYRRSRLTSPALLPSSTTPPNSSTASSTPRATSAKNGLAASMTTSPMVRLEPVRSILALSLRT